MWQERMIGDLAAEFGGPAPGDGGAAGKAVPFGGEVVVANQIAVTADHGLPAIGAARVFEIAHPSGEVTGVDVAQARLLTDVGGAKEILGASVGWIFHLVILVKGGDVPGDVG